MAMNQLYDPIRCEWVDAQPEEKIRQKWILWMKDKLNYPPQYIVVEKTIKALPHLSGDLSSIPDRRVDLLIYGKKEYAEDLIPLLLIECKDTPLNQKALFQVKGYNHYIKAAYIAIANERGILLRKGSFDAEEQVIDFLPSYNELLQSVVTTNHF